MCIKELTECADGLTRDLRGGSLPKDSVLRDAGPDEAINMWRVTAKVIKRLEGAIKAHADPGAHPEGWTQPAAHALGVLRDLNVTADSCDMLMCGGTPLRLCSAHSTRAWGPYGLTASSYNAFEIFIHASDTILKQLYRSLISLL